MSVTTREAGSPHQPPLPMLYLSLLATPREHPVVLCAVIIYQRVLPLLAVLLVDTRVDLRGETMSQVTIAATLAGLMTLVLQALFIWTSFTDRPGES